MVTIDSMEIYNLQELNIYISSFNTFNNFQEIYLAKEYTWGSNNTIINYNRIFNNTIYDINNTVLIL